MGGWVKRKVDVHFRGIQLNNSYHSKLFLRVDLHYMSWINFRKKIAFYPALIFWNWRLKTLSNRVLVRFLYKLGGTLLHLNFDVYEWKIEARLDGINFMVFALYTNVTQIFDKDILKEWFLIWLSISTNSKRILTS